jgi:phosphohistidine phosphatase
MEVYLLRHGIADDDSPTGRDADRPLTDQGRRKLHEVLKLAAAASVAPAVVVSSPYLRAKQTAEIATELLGCKEEIHYANALTPEADPEELWMEIRNAYRGHSSVLLASHEPLMGRSLGYLLGQPGMLVDFKKGALVRVDIEGFGIQPRGILKWMLVPKLAGAS